MVYRQLLFFVPDLFLPLYYQRHFIVLDQKPAPAAKPNTFLSNKGEIDTLSGVIPTSEVEFYASFPSLMGSNKFGYFLI